MSLSINKYNEATCIDVITDHDLPEMSLSSNKYNEATCIDVITDLPEMSLSLSKYTVTSNTTFISMVLALENESKTLQQGQCRHE